MTEAITERTEQRFILQIRHKNGSQRFGRLRLIAEHEYELSITEHLSQATQFVDPGVAAMTWLPLLMDEPTPNLTFEVAELKRLDGNYHLANPQTILSIAEAFHEQIQMMPSKQQIAELEKMVEKPSDPSEESPWDVKEGWIILDKRTSDGFTFAIDQSA